MMKGWSPFGFIPDILSGKSPTQALEDGVKTAGTLAAIYSTGGAAGATNPALIDSAVGTAGYGASSATPAASGGLLGGMKGAMGSMKPYMEAAGAASQVKGLLGDGGSQPIQAPQVAQGNPAGAQTLLQLYQQGMQLSPQDQARLQRKSMWG